MFPMAKIKARKESNKCWRTDEHVTDKGGKVARSPNSLAIVCKFLRFHEIKIISNFLR